MNILLIMGLVLLYSYFLFSFSYEKGYDNGYKQAVDDVNYLKSIIEKSLKQKES